MPKGPQGQCHPSGAGALAVHVCRIATGEIEETHEPPADSGNTIASRRASIAGKARSAALTPERRSEIAAKPLKPAGLIAATGLFMKLGSGSDSISTATWAELDGTSLIIYEE